MKIAGISSALPSKEITNEWIIDEILDRSKKHLSRLKLKLVETLLRQGFMKSGTQIRFVRDVGEKAIDVTTRAAKDALKKAEMEPEDIDLLIYTGVGRGWLEPAMATVFQSQLGLKNATCFDVMDACASWIRSLSIAKSFIAQGTYKNIMVLNSEFNNKEFCDQFEIESPDQLHHSFAQFTMGEAATATILTADGDNSNFYFSFQTWGDKHDLCQIPLPNADEYLSKDYLDAIGMLSKKEARKQSFIGKPMVFFARSTELINFIVDKLGAHFKSDTNLNTRTYDIVFGHDASEYSTQMALKRMKVDPNLAVRTHSRFGNTVSASIPLALSTAVEEKRLDHGMNVLLICGSAGVSTAFCSFSY